MYMHLFSTGLFYFVLFFSHNILCYNQLNYFYFFTIFFLVLSVVLAQVLFHVSRFLKLYVNFFENLNCITCNLYAIVYINSTELVNEFTTEDGRCTVETCLVLNLKLLSIS